MIKTDAVGEFLLSHLNHIFFSVFSLYCFHILLSLPLFLSLSLYPCLLPLSRFLCHSHNLLPPPFSLSLSAGDCSSRGFSRGPCVPGGSLPGRVINYETLPGLSCGYVHVRTVSYLIKFRTSLGPFFLRFRVRWFV
jgi:hypothetical protein